MNGSVARYTTTKPSASACTIATLARSRKTMSGRIRASHAQVAVNLARRGHWIYTTPLGRKSHATAAEVVLHGKNREVYVRANGRNLPVLR